MPPMRATPTNTRSLKHRAVALADGAVPGVAPARRRQGLDDEERHGDDDEHAVGGEEHEEAAPVEDQQQLRPDDRGEDRRETVHEREAGQHPHERLPAEQVADHRHRDDAAGRGTGTLQHAEHPEPADVGRERGADARGHVHARREDQREPPADLVAPRAP